MTAPARFIEFDGYRVDRQARSVCAPDGSPVVLTARALDVLLYLLDHADRVVEKDELLAAVWSGRVVEENNLAQAISTLRRGLGGRATRGGYIMTFPGRGYRFAADIDVCRVKAPQSSTERQAQQAYLAGRYLNTMPGAGNLRRAIQYFRDALYIDPTMARAWAGQAFAWRTLPIAGDADPHEAFPLAHAAVERALELDPDLAEAHSSRGFIHFWYDWDWDRANAAFQRAIALNPDLAEARQGYAHLLNNLGQFDAAVDQIRRARDLDPLSPIIGALEAFFLHWSGRSDEARTRIERTLELAPDFWVALNMRGTLQLETGAPAAAVDDLERASELSGGSTQALALLGCAYVQNDQAERAAALLQQLEARRRQGYVPATALATVRNALGDTDGALDLLEKACAERDLRLTFLKVDRRWDNLRQHPRFVSLATKLNI